MAVIRHCRSFTLVASNADGFHGYLARIEFVYTCHPEPIDILPHSLICTTVAKSGELRRVD